MRLTGAGWGALALAALTLAAAAASGNNLLYLLYGLIAASLIFSAAALRAMRLSVSAEAADPLPRRTPTMLRLRAVNRGRWAARMLRARLGPRSAPMADALPGSGSSAALPVELPLRGVNRLEGVSVESLFPFGLLARAFPALAEPIALPRASLEAEGGEDAEDEGSAEGARRARSGDVEGLRPYREGDEPRLINWKAVARTGRLVSNEFSRGGAKVTVRARPGAGPEYERALERAAGTLLRAEGSEREYRLVTDAEDSGFGRGPAHLRRTLRSLALLGEGASPRPVPAPRGSPRACPVPASMAYLCVPLMGAALLLVEEIPRWAAVFPIPAALAGWALDRAGRRVPDAVWRTGSLAVLFYTLLVGWRMSGITVANTHLLIYLLTYCAMNPKDALGMRRLFVILFLAFFLVSGQTISLWYFPTFLAFALLAAAWLTHAAGRRPSPAALAAPCAACLLLCGAVFAATPRTDPSRRRNPLAAMALNQLQVREDFTVAFTENVSLGFYGRLKKSSARALRIKPVQPPGRPRLVLRVRGSAFDRFDGRGWTKSPLDFRYRVRERVYWSAEGKAWAPRSGGRLLLPGPRPPADATVLEFTVFPMNVAVLFTAGRVREVSEPDNAVYFDDNDTLYFGSAYHAGARYQTVGDPERVGYGEDVLDYERTLREKFLQLPGPDRRQEELALRVTAKARGALEKARAIEAFLQRGYGYSAFSDDRGRDLDDFLFEAHRGNCEYFATAAAVLLRRAGVPSRLVSGFVADQWNEYGGFFDVRQGQAHAWAEAWVPGRGWITVDPTPPEGFGDRAAEEALELARRWFDAMQVRWYRHVIGYDSFVQRNTFRRARGSFAREWAARAKGLSRAARPWAPWAAGAALLAAALWALPRRRGPRTAFELAQETAGLSRRPGQTAREAAREAARARPALAALEELAELHYRELYSGERPGPEQRREAERLLSSVRRGMRAGK